MTKRGRWFAFIYQIISELELTKKTPNCLEYVVVHEMTHLLERHHNERFTMLMNKFLPNWRLYKDELNHFPLGIN